VEAENFPALQALHVPDEEAPVVAEYVPALQALHNDAPEAEYVPALQALHNVAPVPA